MVFYIQDMTITECKQDIKERFRKVGIHVTVNHSVNTNNSPEVGFHVSVRRKRTKDFHRARPVNLHKATVLSRALLWDYAYSVELKDR